MRTFTIIIPFLALAANAAAAPVQARAVPNVAVKVKDPESIDKRGVPDVFFDLKNPVQINSRENTEIARNVREQQ